VCDVDRPEQLGQSPGGWLVESREKAQVEDPRNPRIEINGRSRTRGPDPSAVHLEREDGGERVMVVDDQASMPPGATASSASSARTASLYAPSSTALTTSSSQ